MRGRGERETIDEMRYKRGERERVCVPYRRIVWLDYGLLHDFHSSITQ